MLRLTGTWCYGLLWYYDAVDPHVRLVIDSPTGHVLTVGRRMPLVTETDKPTQLFHRAVDTSILRRARLTSSNREYFMKYCSQFYSPHHTNGNMPTEDLNTANRPQKKKKLKKFAVNLYINVHGFSWYSKVQYMRALTMFSVAGQMTTASAEWCCTEVLSATDSCCAVYSAWSNYAH